MGGTRPVKTSAYLVVAAIAAIVLAAGGLGYLVTTFLFAFSGGQYRMVGVVNLVALLVIVIGAAVGAVTWRLRSRGAAVLYTAIVTGVAWVAAVIAEWLMSFSLGAA